MKYLKKQSIPNYLTCFRMILVPVYICLYLTEHYRLSGVAFLLAGVTDVVDGYIARKNNWVTDIGKLLDPLADKLMLVSAVTCLTWVGDREVHLPVWIFLIILIKEILQISGAAFILGEKRIYVHARWYGKVSTVILYIVILTVTFISNLVNQQAVEIMCAVSIAIMIFTFISYLFDYRKAVALESNPISVSEIDEKINSDLNRKIDERIDEKLNELNKKSK